MAISARNHLKGTVKKLVPGAINSEVTVEVAPGIEIVSVITKSSAERLAVEEGKEIYVVIKSSDVMLATE
ncbi:MAG: molybdopterin-binding protein [Oscillatoria sp. PMC 1051.18]|uniref:TOBE domain-containing protein n=1 Tax=Oscillatoria salina TaxID=331517 RepID=UPI0013BB9094|nr:molybdopterin-binding protein [Oscillatoria salina]MBZ8181672.1 transporter [Oscillatoria salina IIICB1]MEC4894982.1 molybdopterin-binding protein [Oscillatoria sp. PMC 1050.18]MEC5031602.1 molybdopterin-binding protein [Oscillatoria sp. PMC 1051.18]NET90675.1 transporter [Kamptonema sp. SIO1D9]